jgi:alkylation response protein AidB-like acyl-CoA dehydrogenase
MVATTHDSSVTTDDLLREVERLRPLIEAHRDRAEADRRLSEVVYDAMLEAGLFGMQAPRAYGGYEFHPVETMRVIEAVARIDSAAAWNLSMNQAIPAFAAGLTDAGVRAIYGDGPTTMAGALNPPVAATRVDGGWRITGRCPFGSGCHHVRWMAMPAMEMEGDRPKVDPATGQPTPFAVYFPRSEAKILDTWHTVGMRGTGSADYAVEDLYVPDYLTMPVGPLRSPAPGFEGPLFRLNPFTALLGEAAVSVGIAAAMVDAATDLCRTKTPAYNSTPLRDQQLAQFLMGRAKARVEASRDTLYRAAEAAYGELVSTGALLSVESKIRLQGAVCFAAEACAEAVRLTNDAIGASSIRIGQPYERHFRDAHVLLQHSDKSSARYASMGRLMFGLENDWIWLSF